MTTMMYVWLEDSETLANETNSTTLILTQMSQHILHRPHHLRIVTSLQSPKGMSRIEQDMYFLHPQGRLSHIS